MRSFEMTVFIDCTKKRIYNYLSRPSNLIDLQSSLTEVEELDETVDEKGILLRSFYSEKAFHYLGLSICRNRILSVIHLTKPNEEMEFRVYARPGIEIRLRYRFQQFNDGRTQVTHTARFVKVNKLFEGFVVEQTRLAQRTLLSNLKARLE